MCKAFSCIAGRDKKVTWKFGTDSHEDLIKIAGYNDDTLDPEKIEFCRIEISPKNGAYLKPDEWVFKIDMDITPTWWTLDHKKACEMEFEKWKKQLYKILSQKEITHPFHNITPPAEITEDHIDLLREWVSVRDSVRDSIRTVSWAPVRQSVIDSVWSFVGSSVADSVRCSIVDSMWASVRDSVEAYSGRPIWNTVVCSMDSIWAYIGSFFILERSAWKYTENVVCEGYPFQSAVTLWRTGLVPSFDENKWRLHGGPNGKILWEGEL